MNVRSLHFTLSILLIGTICTSIGKVIPLSDHVDEIFLERTDFQVVEDVTGELELVDIVQLKGRDDKEVKHVRDLNAAYWVIIQYKDDSKHNNWVLEGLDHHIDEFSVYSSDKEIQTGASRSFSKREYKLKNLIFDLPRNDSKERKLYIRIKASSAVGFEFKLRNSRVLVEYSSIEYYLLGIYYGVLIIMACYNLLLYFSIREKVYLLYILYVVSCVFVSLEEDGIGFQLIWPELPQFNFILTKFLAPVLFMVSFISYSVSFLGLRKSYNKLYRGVVLIAVLFVGLHLLLGVFYQNYAFINDFYVLPFLLLFICALKVYKDGNAYSRYFLLGNSFVFISIIIGFLRSHYLIPANVLTVYSFNIGVLIEVVVLSFALGDKINSYKKEKEASQKQIIEQLNLNSKLQLKVNKELEAKVKQRTQRLQEKTEEALEVNKELVVLKDQLLKMNEHLDLDNWRLSKKVKQERKARLFDKGMSFDEFNAIFVDELSCLRYLEEIKWQKEYSCRNCNNVNYSKKSGQLTRKCSQCGTEESVISGTLYHGLRFPLRKAFYLTYLEVSDTGKYGLEHLSEILGIHRNTCSRFNNKIRERVEEYKSSKGNLPVSWSDIVVF